MRRERKGKKMREKKEEACDRKGRESDREEEKRRREWRGGDFVRVREGEKMRGGYREERERDGGCCMRRE